MSFAGQQDTFLNVVGENNLLQAIIGCWSSLWTARAIGYRIYNRVSHLGLGLAIVVQTMVDSQVSGVMFTANPLSGLRTETVIDASYGLGEALVSGKVEPDHYVVDSKKEQIILVKSGAKALSIRSNAGGGTITSSEPANTTPTLTDEKVLIFTRLGQNVEQLYDGFPQDIEFAWFEEKPYLLQARPITSLFPTPKGMPAEPLQVLFSFAAVQGVLDPITPLGMEIFQTIFNHGCAAFWEQCYDRNSKNHGFCRRTALGKYHRAGQEYGRQAHRPGRFRLC